MLLSVSQQKYFQRRRWSQLYLDVTVKHSWHDILKYSSTTWIVILTKTGNLRPFLGTDSLEWKISVQISTRNISECPA